MAATTSSGRISCRVTSPAATEPAQALTKMTPQKRTRAKMSAGQHGSQGLARARNGLACFSGGGFASGPGYLFWSSSDFPPSASLFLVRAVGDTIAPGRACFTRGRVGCSRPDGGCSLCRFRFLIYAGLTRSNIRVLKAQCHMAWPLHSLGTLSQRSSWLTLLASSRLQARNKSPLCFEWASWRPSPTVTCVDVLFRRRLGTTATQQWHTIAGRGNGWLGGLAAAASALGADPVLPVTTAR